MKPAFSLFDQMCAERDGDLSSGTDLAGLIGAGQGACLKCWVHLGLCPELLISTQVIAAGLFCLLCDAQWEAWIRCRAKHHLLVHSMGTGEAASNSILMSGHFTLDQLYSSADFFL